MKAKTPVALTEVGEPAVSRELNPAYHRLPVIKRYEVDARTGCWEWLGWRLNSGYGRCKVNGATVQAHRVFYAHHVGRIPEGHDMRTLAAIGERRIWDPAARGGDA